MSDEYGNATNEAADRLGRQIARFAFYMFLFTLGVMTERWCG